MKNSTALILIVISIGLYYTMISPQYAQVKLLRAQADQYTGILANVTDLTQKRDALEVKYKAIPATDVDRLGKVLPDHVDEVRLANDFSGIAARYGIALKSIKAEEVTSNNVQTIQTDPNGQQVAAAQTGGLQKVTVDLSFVASYDNFRKFLADIEESLRIIDVSALSFTPSDNGITEYKITLTTYWLK